MSLKRVAVRYAEALIELAQEQKKLDTVKNDMDLLRSLTKNKEFFSVLKSPIIPNPKKEAVVNKLLEGKVDDLTLRFLILLIQKERSALLPDIALEFEEAYRTIMGISKVKIYAGEKMNDKSVKKLVKKLQDGGLIKDKAEVEQELNEDIIGGFAVVVGDYLYNATVNKQLAELKRDFSENLYKSQIVKRL